ncbi:MAG: Methyltransferase type 11, S-adenosyl-L-methionine-dependent [Acidimicrobiia bacterium]|nr:Methyltransferase type 11, S-adenosyl-L-methionine-dependent [Acidimicrobiia bacterium]
MSGDAADAADPDDAMGAEFDVVAGWTATVVAELGDDVAIPAACRGSGSPAALAWLADALVTEPGAKVLDVGAGLGGPAAWLAQHYGAQPVVTDPMPRAVLGSRRLFGLPAAVAEAQRLPVAEAAFDAAWALGVLCTTDAQGRRQLLANVRRALRPGGALGLLVLVATHPGPINGPEGNDFPTMAELEEALTGAGFEMGDCIAASSLPEAPADWQQAADDVDRELERRYGHRSAWQVSDTQQRRMGEVLNGGEVVTMLVKAVAR